MTDDPFLVDLHGRSGLAASQIVRIAVRATGRPVEHHDRVVRGRDNEVHRVVVAGDTAVFVRIRRYGEGSLAHEIAAMGLAREVGVPAPDVLWWEPAADEADGLPVAVLAAAAGRPARDVLATAPPADRERLWSAVGEVMARLHGVAMPGVWRPDDDGVWPDPVAVRTGFAGERRAERAALSNAGLTVDETDRVLGLLVDAPDPPFDDFVLCHGDLGPDHVFVDRDLRVSGVIDWGMWHAGSPVGELAALVRTAGWGVVDPVLSGYGGDRWPGPDGLRRDLATTVAVQTIGHIAHGVAIGDTGETAAEVASLRRAFDLLDRR